MAKIKYIGKKERKVDTFAGTGIVWHGNGDVQDVPDKLVPVFLHHTDSFELAGQSAAAAPATKDVVKTDKVDGVKKEDDTKKDDDEKTDSPPLVDLASMDKSALKDYAQRYFNETFHPNTGEAKMRERIIGLMNRG